MNKMYNILVLDGNSSQCLPLIHSFYKKGHRITLVCPGIFSSGYFSRYVHQRLIWPRITGNEDQFYQLFYDHIRQNSYDLVLGLGDVSTSMLSSHKEEVEKYVKTVVPDYDVYINAADKYRTMKLCMENEIPCPLTFDVEKIEIDKIDGKLSFPVVVKPKKGVGAVGFTVISNAEELKGKLPFLKKEYGNLLIQEYIPNSIQYTAEVFCDQKSELKTCVIAEKKRFFPINGGTSSCNVTIDSPEIKNITEQLIRALNWTGIANVDFILDPRDNTPKVIEINPRIGATVKIAFLAGVDIAEMLIQLANNEEINLGTDYKKDIVMRNLLLDLLWFLFSSYREKKQSNPAFLKFYNKNTYYQSISYNDPLTFVGFFLGYIIMYANLKKLKNKLGINKRRHYDE